jgi:hypothetical protein
MGRLQWLGGPSTVDRKKGFKMRHELVSKHSFLPWILGFQAKGGRGKGEERKEGRGRGCCLCTNEKGISGCLLKSEFQPCVLFELVLRFCGQAMSCEYLLNQPSQKSRSPLKNNKVEEDHFEISKHLIKRKAILTIKKT